MYVCVRVCVCGGWVCTRREVAGGSQGGRREVAQAGTGWCARARGLLPYREVVLVTRDLDLVQMPGGFLLRA